ncbi:SDR family oxidoreductase [Massilia glaciei]|uniref:Short chain dehydrogenase n=1 Tax=Massilia glaciei TaxID=1524097 RepID=A0A2U2HLY2_9BURK|nr:SDR family oxidoreductase [Massilia glaciei]PWF48435.1 short chain dehydrogenase [Massilia glaciei]
MRILLTGASGFVGRHLLGPLLAEGHELVCALRDPGAPLLPNPHPAPQPSAEDRRLRTIHADFSKNTHKAVWLARLAGIDIVINTVGIFRQSRRQRFDTLHTHAACALFAACVEAQVRLVIQFSALGADDAADTPYHLSKRAADDYLASLPLRAFIVQPSLIYGKDGASARLFKALASMPFALRLGGSGQLVQPIHVDDVAGAVVGLIRHPPPVPASGATAPRIALVGPAAMSFTDYLGALRRALGMGRLRVLRLSSAAARTLARAARLVPGLPFDQDALRMLERGNTADPFMTARLIGRMPRPVAEFITDPGAERARAKLDWLLPPLRLSIALVWIAAAIVSFGLFPLADSLHLLARAGVPDNLRPLMLHGAAALDLALGLGILLLCRRRWLWLAQIGLVGFYTVFIAWRLPEFLLHPFGPLSKNLPMLAALWLLYSLEEK